MPTLTLNPTTLDQAAARLTPQHVTREWERITSGYQRTAPKDRTARDLLGGKTVDDLIDEALRNVPAHGTRPAVDVKLPGRLSRLLPDFAHRTRADLSHPPSVQLAVAAEILRKWGWQNKPHHLRDLRGRRCICGAILTAVALGIGTEHAAERAAWHVLQELRSRNWQALIGDWNQRVCRTPQQAIDVVTAAHRRALTAGQ